MLKRTPQAILLYFSSSGLRPSIQFQTAHSFSASPSPAPPSPHFLHSSSFSSPGSAQASWKHRNEEGNKSVRVTVWWDYENCPVPNGVNPYKVVQRITSALRAEGIRGPVSITAFADVQCLNRPCQEALFATGVSFNHVPRRGKNSSDKSILADLVYWVAQNPPPAHFFLISGDGDFTSMLHRLRLNNYNVLIATLNHSTSALSSCATVLWYWGELLQGVRVAGKHFNQPPDGFYSSWYGQFKGPLEDPFYLNGDFAVSQPEECAKLPADSKTYSIPKRVVDGIVESLSCFSDGLSAKDLLIRLKKRNIIVDDKFFGHGSFVDLISSLPHLVRTTRSRNGRVVICKLKSAKAMLKMAESGVVNQPEDEYEEEMLDKDEAISLLSSNPTNEKHHLAKDEKASHASSQSSPSQESLSAKNTTFSCMNKDDDVDTADKGMDSVKDIVHSEPLEAEDPGTSKGFFRRLWTILTGRYFNKITRTSSGDSTSMTGRKDEPLESTQVVGNELKTEPGFFSKLVMRINQKKIGGKETQMSETCPGVTRELKSNQAKGEDERQQQIDLKPEYHELFLNTQFWESLESFLRTEKAAEVVTKSMSRIDLVQGLQKEGPLLLGSLTTNNILYMINLLISENWLEECSSETPLFKLIYPARKSSLDGLSKVLPSRESQRSSQATQWDCDDEQGQISIGTSLTKTVGKRIPKNLSDFKVWFWQVFSDNSSVKVEDLKDCYEKEFGRKLDSFFYGYFNVDRLLEACCGSSEMKGKSHQLPLEQILTDCEKLVTESLAKKPTGISLATIRPMFQERYGYSLNHKELGYPRLSSMLQLIPGVRVESNLILPALAPRQLGSDDDDFSWEELGPVKDGMDGANNQNTENVVANEMELDEPSVSDDEDSLPVDDDGSTMVPDRSSGQGVNSRKVEEESSLIRILESWHKKKENKENTVSQSVVGLVDCSEGGGEDRLPLESRPVVPLSSSFKGKRVKAYTFVSDGPADKDKVANEILQCLK